MFAGISHFGFWHEEKRRKKETEINIFNCLGIPIHTENSQEVIVDRVYDGLSGLQEPYIEK